MAPGALEIVMSYFTTMLKLISLFPMVVYCHVECEKCWPVHFRGLGHMPFSRMNKEQHPHSYVFFFLGNGRGNVSEKVMSNCESYYTLNCICHALVNSKQGGGGGAISLFYMPLEI